MSEGRLRVTIEVGPTDTGSVLLFRWLLAQLIAVFETAPCPVRFRVEVVRDDDVD